MPSFKTGSEGRVTFFPRGRFGTGYDLPAEVDVRLLRRRVTLLSAARVALVIVASTGGMIACGTAGALFSAMGGLAIGNLSYALWLRSWRRGRRPSAEVLTIDDIHREMARDMTTGRFAFLLGASFTFVASGIVAFLIDPNTWPTDLLTAGFFGITAAASIRARRERSRGASNATVG